MADETTELNGDTFLTTDGVFIPVRPSLLHFSNISEPFEKALKEYVNLDEKEFIALLDSLPETTKKDPNFLNVKFEDLFNIPVSTGHREVGQVAQMERSSGVFSQGVTVEINAAFDENDFELLSELPILPFFFNVSIPIFIPSSNTELPPPVTPIPSLPTTPSITVDAAFTGGLNTEVLLNTQTSVQFGGNVFLLGASAGTVNAFFAPPARSGSTENRSIPGEVVLITPEGNTLTFYVLNVGGHDAGDFVYTLNHAILTPPQAFTVNSGERIFTDKFVYSVTNNQNATNVGAINVQIIDDKPVATDQSAANTIAEANIPGTGSAQQAGNNELTGSLIVPSIQATPPGPGDLSDNRFGANGGFVSDVTVVGGITLDLLTSFLVIDSQGNTLEVEKLTGNYTYTLSDPFHNVNNQPFNEVFTYQFRDFEGQTASANLMITSLDDAPIAVNAIGSLSEAGIQTQGSSGSAILDTLSGRFVPISTTTSTSRYGADGAANTGGVSDATLSNVVGTSGITGTTTTGTISNTMIANSNGGFTNANLNHAAIIVTDTLNNTLVIDAITSQYVYTQNAAFTNSNNNPVILTYTYQLKDGDGSTDSAELTITVADDAPVAVNTSGSLSEANIQNIGSSGSAIPDTLSGRFVPISTTTSTSRYGADGAANTGGVSDATLSNVVGTSGITGTTTTGTISNTMIANSNGGFTNANLNHAAIIVTDTLNNTLVIDAITSQYVYTQNAAFTNSNNNPVILTYTYQLKDGDGSTNSAQLTITVADDIPIATEKLNTANETLLFVNGTETASGNLITDNSGFGISKLGSDGGTVSQVNGISAVAGIIIAPTTYGSITVYTTDQGSFVKGDYVYSLDSAKTSPVNDALGQVIDTISYQLMDGDGSTSSADLNVTVTLNQPPVANNDVGTTEQAVSLNVAAAGVLINDTVSAGDTKIVSAVNGVLADVGAKVTLSSGALLTLNSDGSYIYDPNGNFLGGGTDSFAYTMSEAEGLTSSANVTITITAPHATNDAGSTKYNAVLTVNAASGLLSNDTKSSADNILLVGVVNGSAANVGGQLVLSSGALLTVNSDGGYSYDPNGQFNLGGTDSFTYQAADGVGSLSNIATVALTIISDTAPVANDDVGSTHVGTPLSVAAPGILANDTDVDVGTTLSVVSVNGSALNVNTQITLASGALLTVNSDGSYNYDANGKFASTGTDNFTYTASDGVLNSSANVTITVLVPPVVFDLNGNGIELISAEDSPAVWLFSSGYHRTGWVSPEDGILVYDAKGNGQINDISAFAFTAFAPGANSDLEALSIAFDTNHDGIFDIHDAHYAQFGIWQDKNSNGIMDNGEYLTLAERGIISLSLTSDHQVLSLNGNNIYGFTTYQMQDGTTHLAADVGLKIGERLSIQDILHEKAEIDFSTLLPQQYSSMQVEESASVAEQSIVLPCEMNFIPHLEEQLTFA